MSFTTLKNTVSSTITTNGTGAVNGIHLRTLINDTLIPALGATKFQGVATPATNPGTPVSEVYYFATEVGVYGNFSSAAIQDEGFHILKYSFSYNSWVKITVFTLKTINGSSIFGTGNLAISGGGSMTNPEVKTAYEANSDTNALTDALLAKLQATLTQTEIDTLVANFLNTEEIQDVIGAMFQNGTHTNITPTYNDVTGTIDLTVTGGGSGGLTQEQVEDVVGNLVNVVGSGVSATYDDANNSLSFSLTGESFTTALKNQLLATLSATEIDAVITTALNPYATKRLIYSNDISVNTTLNATVFDRDIVDVDSSAGAINLTVPILTGLVKGDCVDFVKKGAQKVAFIEGTNVSISSREDYLAISGETGAVTLIYKGVVGTTHHYDLIGSLEE